MDLAIISAAFTFWLVAQGGIALSRWLQTTCAVELLWGGLGSIQLAIGTMLFAARYFDAHFLLTVGLANIALLSGVTFLVQGVFSADGYPASPYPLMIPGLVWGAAMTLEYYQDSVEARMWLFCLLTLAATGLALFHVIRAGLLLRGRRILAIIWGLVVLTVATKMVGLHDIAPAFFDRFGSGGWHMAHLLMVFLSGSAIAAFNTTRAYVVAAQSAFTSHLARQLTATCVHHTSGQEASPTRGDLLLWTLRLDPLDDGGTSETLTIAGLAGEVALAIRATCLRPKRVIHTGPDRVIWITEQSLSSYGKLVNRLAELSARPFFPARGIAVGCTPIGALSILSASERADRGATIIMPR